MKHYDYILIGTGQATGTIITELVKQEKKIAVIENDKVGGTCVNWGCTPTKTLVASARAAHIVRRSKDFGVDVKGYSINYKKVMKRINHIRIPGSASFREWLEEVTDFYPGSGVFEDDHRVKVGDNIIYGETIIIHTGTDSRKPAFPGIESMPWLDNKEILDLNELPENLIIIGGSYVGLEFAQAFSRLGSKVTVLQRGPRIMSKEDEDVANAAKEILEDENIEIICNTSIIKMEQSRRGIVIHFNHLGEKKAIMGSHLLVAIGRLPNTSSLNLDKCGVLTNEKGFIKTNEVLQTSVPHIYALGDVNGKGAFTHTSVHDGQVFLSHQKGGYLKSTNKIPIHSMFIDPPLSRVGMTEDQALKSGKKILKAVKQMASISRAKEKDETTGFIKLLVEKETNLILGATILGIGSDETIGMIALAMQSALPYTAIMDTVLPHPTVSENIPWIFQDLKEIN